MLVNFHNYFTAVLNYKLATKPFVSYPTAPTIKVTK